MHEEITHTNTQTRTHTHQPPEGGMNLLQLKGSKGSPQSSKLLICCAPWIHDLTS
ncbi:hypothetical protein J4Q44_G00364920 [Coregonus suidteri]|uniref:Uncharacterized protein n=1 Tax=Coregonus suidteri TaxID=861788 RepID=A0AAN8KUS3_9TELE